MDVLNGNYLSGPPTFGFVDWAEGTLAHLLCDFVVLQDILPSFFQMNLALVIIFIVKKNFCVFLSRWHKFFRFIFDRLLLNLLLRQTHKGTRNLKAPEIIYLRFFCHLESFLKFSSFNWLSALKVDTFHMKFILIIVKKLIVFKKINIY